MNGNIVNQQGTQRPSKSAKVFLIIGAVIIGLIALAYLIFQVAIFVDVVNTPPADTSNNSGGIQIDTEGLSDAVYLIFTIITTASALACHVIGTIFTSIGLVINSKGAKSKELKIWGIAQILLPIIIYILGIISMFIIEHV